MRGGFGRGMWFNVFSMLFNTLFDVSFNVLFDVSIYLGLLGLRLGVVDGLQVLIDRIGRRLGGLVDKELDSGLRYFNRNWINKHEIILLPRKLSGAHLHFVKRWG